MNTALPNIFELEHRACCCRSTSRGTRVTVTETEPDVFFDLGELLTEWAAANWSAFFHIIVIFHETNRKKKKHNCQEVSLDHLSQRGSNSSNSRVR